MTISGPGNIGFTWREDKRGEVTILRRGKRAATAARRRPRGDALLALSIHRITSWPAS